MFNRRAIAALVVLAALLAFVPALQGQEAEETPVAFIELAGPVAELHIGNDPFPLGRCLEIVRIFYVLPGIYSLTGRVRPGCG